MAIDLKNLSKTIALCRKTGVLELEVDGIKLKLTSEAPHKKQKHSGSPVEEAPQYTDDQLLEWSAAGIPMDGTN